MTQIHSLPLENDGVTEDGLTHDDYYRIAES